MKVRQEKDGRHLKRDGKNPGFGPAPTPGFYSVSVPSGPDLGVSVQMREGSLLVEDAPDSASGAVLLTSIFPFHRRGISG